MSQCVTRPDDLYARLEAAARVRGLHGIPELLEVWHAQAEELNRRKQVAQRIDALRARLFATYGEMPDSTAVIRADRER
jgi:hypothetical protein